MAINFDTALGIHDTALILRSRRAAVLANNLANTDTPNFKARDMDFYRLLKQSAERQSAAVTMAATHSQHQTGTLEGSDSELLYRTPQQASIDGNTVEEQVEHAEFMKNALAYQASFEFLNSRFKGLKTAIRGEL